MKKIFLLTVLATTFLLLCSCDTAFNSKETESDHVHSYDVWEITKEATCTEEGTKIGSCSCGDKLTEIIPLADHVLVMSSGIAPSCTEPGSSDGSWCAVCYTVFVEETIIQPTGHFEVIDEAVPPSCTEDGLTEGKHCSACGEILVAQEKISATHSWIYSYDSSSHWQVCNGCGITTNTASHQNTEGGYCTVCNATVSPTAGIVYDVDKSGEYAFVSGYNGSSANIVISSQYNELPVTLIGKEAFKGKEITSVFIPDTVTEIASYAFAECKTLEEMILPDSLTCVDSHAFDNCTKLLKTENGVVYVLNIAVSNTGSASAEIRNGTTLIANYAFAGNTSLVTLTLPDSLKRIGEGAFSECSSLSSVSFGNSLEFIGVSAFYWCSAIKTITLPDSLIDIAHSAFSGCISIHTVEFGSRVSTIGPYAFANCVSIEKITLPVNITSIGGSAFYHCAEIKSISLPFVGESRDDSQNSHFGYIFGATSSYKDNDAYVPTSLKNVTITDIESIEDRAFFGCEDIKTLVISKKLKYVGISAFEGCANLSNVFFKGSEAAWKNVIIRDGNSFLLNAAVTCE